MEKSLAVILLWFSFEIKDETSQMNDKQKKELQDIYTDIILKVADE